jgi:hypothetical protein
MRWSGELNNAESITADVLIGCGKHWITNGTHEKQWILLRLLHQQEQWIGLKLYFTNNQGSEPPELKVQFWVQFDE